MSERRYVVVAAAAAAVVVAAAAAAAAVVVAAAAAAAAVCRHGSPEAPLLVLNASDVHYTQDASSSVIRGVAAVILSSPHVLRYSTPFDYDKTTAVAGLDVSTVDLFTISI